MQSRLKGGLYVMKSNKIMKLFAAAAVFTALFCGCSQITTIFGKAPNEDKVMQEVQIQCPTEQIELISQEKSQTIPEEVVYHFGSLQRNLEFDAVSLVDDITMFQPGDTGIYSKEIEVGYVDAVMNLYRNDEYYAKLYEVCNGGTTVYFSNPSDFDQIAQNIVMLSDIYAPEKEYNTEEWMREHPLDTICAVWVSDINNTKDADKVRTAHIDINGCITYDDVKEILQSEYNTKLNSGEIPQ